MKVYYYHGATRRLHAIALQHAELLHTRCFSRLTHAMLIVHDDGVPVPRTKRTMSISLSKIQKLYDIMCARQCAECIDDLARILAACLSKAAADDGQDEFGTMALEEPD